MKKAIGLIVLMSFFTACKEGEQIKPQTAALTARTLSDSLGVARDTITIVDTVRVVDTVYLPSTTPLVDYRTKIQTLWDGVDVYMHHYNDAKNVFYNVTVKITAQDMSITFNDDPQVNPIPVHRTNPTVWNYTCDKLWDDSNCNLTLNFTSTYEWHIKFVDEHEIKITPWSKGVESDEEVFYLRERGF